MATVETPSQKQSGANRSAPLKFVAEVNMGAGLGPTPD
jgi:hypothetical protein